MPKRLADGEKRVIRASTQWSMFKNDQFKITAERYDSETPFIHLQTGETITNVIVMTDVEALDLIDRLQRALNILPSSK